MAVNWDLRGTDQGKWKEARRRGREGTNLGALELVGFGVRQTRVWSWVATETQLTQWYFLSRHLMTPLSSGNSLEIPPRTLRSSFGAQMSHPYCP